MADPLANPFKQSKQPETSKRRKFTYKTFYFELVDADHLIGLAAQLETIANHNYKYGITELTGGNKVDGTPFVILRIQNDIDILEKKRTDISIKVDTYSASDLEQVDTIINRAFTENSKQEFDTILLKEKRFTHIVLNVCIVLIWAEVKKGSKFMEALSGLRTILSTRL